MLRFFWHLVRHRPVAALRHGAALAVCLALSGCCVEMNLRGEGFPQNDLADLAGDLRGADGEDDPAAFSNKAKQISRNLGSGQQLRQTGNLR
jgi:hypothetical protein